MRNRAQRERILEVGLALFRRFGMRRVTMDDLARELRISKKTLYRHFPDKAALVAACADRVFGQVAPVIRGALEGEGPVTPRLLTTWRAFSMLPRLISPQFIADLQAGYPEIWRSIDRRRRAVIASFERLFAAGVASGEIRPEIHPKVALRVLFAVLERVMVPDVLATAEFTLAEAVQTVATMLLRGVLVNPAPLSLAVEMAPPAKRAGELPVSPRPRSRSPKETRS